MSDKPVREGRTKRTVLTVLGIILVLIFLIAACVLAYVYRVLNKINRVDPESEYTVSSSAADEFLYNDPELVTIDPNTTETYIKLEDITFPTVVLDPTEPVVPTTTLEVTQPTTEPGPSETKPAPVETKPQTTTPSTPDIYGDHVVNIMLVGQDRREDQGRQRSDTMILVSVNKSDGTIALISFMRDQYVQIPGYNPNKLNAAYAFGGMSLLSKTLEVNFGVKLNGMIEVDFGGFGEIIDLLGGVELTLTKAEAKYLNDLYDVKLLDSPVVVGKNRLDAEQALVYARLREIDSDYRRASRQRAVIIAIIEACKNLPLNEMLGLVEKIMPIVTTNMTNSQIISYAVELFPMLAGAQINTLRVPIDGTFDDGMVQVRKGFVGWFQYNIDFEANKKALFEVFRRKN